MKQLKLLKLLKIDIHTIFIIIFNNLSKILFVLFSIKLNDLIFSIILYFDIFYLNFFNFYSINSLIFDIKDSIYLKIIRYLIIFSFSIYIYSKCSMIFHFYYDIMIMIINYIVYNFYMDIYIFYTYI